MPLRFACHMVLSIIHLQVYLTYNKTHPSMTLLKAYA